MELNRLEREALKRHCHFEGNIDLNELEKKLYNMFNGFSIQLTMAGGAVLDDYILLKVESDIGESIYRIDFDRDREEIDIDQGRSVQLTNLSKGISKTINIVFPYDKQKEVLLGSTKLKNINDTKLTVKQINNKIIFDCYHGDKGNSHHYEIEIADLSSDEVERILSQAEKILLAIAPVYEARSINLIELFKQFVSIVGGYINRIELSSYITRENDHNQIQKSSIETLTVQNGTLTYASGSFPFLEGDRYYFYDCINNSLSVDGENFYPNWWEIEQLSIEADSNEKRLLSLQKHLMKTKKLVHIISNSISAEKDSSDYGNIMQLH